MYEETHFSDSGYDFLRSPVIFQRRDLQLTSNTVEFDPRCITFEGLHHLRGQATVIRAVLRKVVQNFVNSLIKYSFNF